jgi:GT2 family glycosyltransferase
MPIRLTIIVVTFNEARHVARLQGSIGSLHKPEGISVETVLVDGGSTDGTADSARAAGFTLVIEIPGGSIPVCRNRGLAEAKGDWIAFVDGDCELAADWLEVAAPLLAEGQPLILAWPAAPPEPMTWVQAAWRFHWLQKNRRFEEHLGARVIRQEGFRLATTRNMIMTRSVAESVGGFNEDLVTGEDTDFAYRAYLAGIPVLGLPTLRAVHHGEPATLRQFFRQQLWHSNRESYRHIMRLTGGKIGGNAPLFSALFLATLLLASAGILIALITDRRSPITLSLPLLALIAAPAALLSWRGRTLRHFPALCILYAAYGLARSLDLAGLSRAKATWKAGTTGRR